QLDRRQVQIVCAFHRSQGDREALACKPGRVEDRDVQLAPPALASTPKYVPEMRHVVPPEHTGLDSMYEVAVMTCLFPFVRIDPTARPYSVCSILLPGVAVDVDARELFHGDLLLSGAVGSHQAHVLSRVKRAFREHDLATCRHGHDDVRGQSSVARCDRCAGPRRDI